MDKSINDALAQLMAVSHEMKDRPNAKPLSTDMPSIFAALKLASTQTQSALLTYKAVEMAEHLLKRCPVDLYKSGMLGFCYTLAPDPCVLHQTIDDVAYPMEASSADTLSNEAAVKAIQMGGVVLYDNHGDIDQMVHTNLLDTNTKLQLLSNVLDYYPYLGDSGHRYRSALVEKMLANLIAKHPQGVISLIRKRSDALMSVLRKESTYSIIQNLVIKVCEPPVLLALYEENERIYHRVLDNKEVKNSLLRRIAELEESDTRYDDLPRSEALDENFCIEAFSLGLRNNTLTSRGLAWLESRWDDCRLGRSSLPAAAASKNKHLRNLIVSYKDYVSQLDAYGPEMPSCIAAMPLRNIGWPHLLEVLYIADGEGVLDTPHRREVHLNMALNHPGDGFVHWAVTGCRGELLTDQAIHLLARLAASKKTGSAYYPASDNWRGLAQVPEQVAIMTLRGIAKNPDTRHLLAGISRDQYDAINDPQDRNLTQILQRINWKSDEIKSQMVSDGYSI